MTRGGVINYDTVTIVPGEFIVNRAYNASNQTEYMGYAPQGTATSTPQWVIRKYTYTSNLITSERIAKNVDWDNKATHTYS